VEILFSWFCCCECKDKGVDTKKQNYFWAIQHPVILKEVFDGRAVGAGLPAGRYPSFFTIKPILPFK
jgi:hypothetical protein